MEDLERLRKLLEDKDLRSMLMGAIQYFFRVGYQEAVARAPATAAVWELGPFGPAVFELLRLICKLWFLNVSNCSYCF